MKFKLSPLTSQSKKYIYTHAYPQNPLHTSTYSCTLLHMKKRINISIEQGVHEDLQQTLRGNGQSLSWWVESQAREYLTQLSPDDKTIKEVSDDLSNYEKKMDLPPKTTDLTKEITSKEYNALNPTERGKAHRLMDEGKLKIVK